MTIRRNEMVIVTNADGSSWQALARITATSTLRPIFADIHDPLMRIEVNC